MAAAVTVTLVVVAMPGRPSPPLSARPAAAEVTWCPQGRSRCSASRGRGAGLLELLQKPVHGLAELRDGLGLYLEAALDDRKETVAVRVLKERFQALIELPQQGGLAPALQIAEERDDPDFLAHLLDVKERAPVRGQLPSP